MEKHVEIKQLHNDNQQNPKISSCLLYVSICFSWNSLLFTFPDKLIKLHLLCVMEEKGYMAFNKWKSEKCDIAYVFSP